MEEKIITSGKSIKISLIIIVILSLAALCLVFVTIPAIYDYYDTNCPFDVLLALNIYVANGNGEAIFISGGIVLVLCLLAVFVHWWLGKNEITVSDKRVFGKAAFGKRVDLPLDSISAVATSFLKGIAVATSSGKISFPMIQNSEEIHKCVSDLLIERQAKAVTPVATIKQEIPQSNADELKKYKELLDMGVITQEEFDAKKKQLLGL